MARRSKTMPDAGDVTRRRLLLAAGELFAQKGYGATSVREIARKARANIAAINYHYRDKESLYREAVRYVADSIMARRAATLSSRDPEAMSRHDLAEAFHGLIDREVRAYLSVDTPRWYAQLLLRAVMIKGPVLDILFEQVLHPNHEVLKRLVLAASPQKSDLEAHLWAHSIMAQIIFYSLAREPVLLELDVNGYSEPFLEAVVDHISRRTLSALGLPSVPSRNASPVKRAPRASSRKKAVRK